MSTRIFERSEARSGPCPFTEGVGRKNRAALLALLLPLAACSTSEQSAGRDPLACKVKGGVFEQICTREDIPGGDGPELVVRAPDGDFRRLLVTGNGRNVAAADGAEPLLVEKQGADSLYVTADGITYRLPVPVAP